MNLKNKPYKLSVIVLILFLPLHLTRTIGAPVTDQQITNAVQDQLISNSTTPAYLIDVNTLDGIVTLNGSISNLLAKEHAAKVAMSVKGVRGVINKIEIESPDMQDHEIERMVNEALVEDPATEAFEINANVFDGQVRLTGAVNSWQEKQLAGHVVKGVYGVKDVINEINVDYTAERRDTEIESEVKQALHNDIRVDDAMVDVEVNNSKIELSGIVGSLSEKYQAETKAWVAGVTSVSSDELKVRQWARDENLRKNKYITRSDEEIKEAIRDAFIYDPRVHLMNIEIQVNDGEVILIGTVDNLKTKKVATSDAKNIVGVFSVKNYLKVRPDEIPENPDLEKNVAQALIRDPFVEKFKIDVDAETGVIYLDGTVDTYFDKFHAEDIASRVPGVVAIENQLSVNETEDRFYGNVAWDSYGSSAYVDVEKDNDKTDWEIKKDIQSELFWSPFINENEIDIIVENGKAILRGNVDTQREKTYAEINAMEGGAEQVENDIEVAYSPDKE